MSKLKVDTIFSGKMLFKLNIKLIFWIVVLVINPKLVN